VEEILSLKGVFGMKIRLEDSSDEYEERADSLNRRIAR
jgi:hypothetical protein